MKKMLISVCFIATMVMSVFVSPLVAQNVQATTTTITTESNMFDPIPTPPKDRPRVLINKEMLPALKERLKSEEFKTKLDDLRALASKNVDGKLPPLGDKALTNIDSRVVNVMKSCAFLYLTEGDKEMGKKAASIAVNIANTVTWSTDSDIYMISRETGGLLLVESIVYDWCYPFLSPADKTAIIKGLDNLVRNSLEYPYPLNPAQKSILVGHLNNYVTHNYKLAMGIALYDTNPEYYEDVAQFGLNQVMPAYNVAYQSGMYFEGAAYGEVRITVVQVWAEIMKAIGVDIMTPKLGDVANRYIYARRPDGYIMTEGDDFNTDYTAPWSRIVIGSFVDMISGSAYNNPLAQYEFKKQGQQFVGPFTNDLYFYLWYNPKAESKSVYEAPLSKYFPSPYGSVIARTGWDEGTDSKAVVAVMNIGERTAGNHQHSDTGSFQLYYKGYLAIDSGIYQGKNGAYGSPHDSNYHKRSIAHNVVQINDPNSSQNGIAGNQLDLQYGPSTIELWSTKPEFQRGKVLSSSIGDDQMAPDYSYIKGEISQAYGPLRVKNYSRSMVFLNFKDSEYPGALIVYDNINTPNSSAEKTFLLHTINEPVVTGSSYTNVMAERGYNGKLVTNTLLPKLDNLVVKKVGGPGHEFEVTGMNYEQPANTATTISNFEAGKWRLELSPKKATNLTQFLNVMQVMDATGGPEPQKVYYTESTDFVGAMIYDRVVFFAKDFANIGKETTISFKGNETQKYKVLITDLKEGYWTAVKEGETANVQYDVVKEGNCLYFMGTPGTYKLTRSDSKTLDLAKKVPSTPLQRTIRVRLDKTGLVFDVPPQIINDRTMVPMRKIFEALGMTVTWDDATSTAKATKKDLTIELTQDSNIAKVNGKEITIDAPATIIDGRTLVPVRFIAESANCDVSWNGDDQIVEILSVKPIVLPEFQRIPLPKIAPVPNKELQELKPFSFSAMQNNDSIPKLFDGGISSDGYWAGADNGAYVEFDFGKVIRLDRVDMAVLSGDKRQVRMTFYVSKDGNEWTPIFGGDASGTTNEFESYNLTPQNIRYFRLVGFGAPDTGSKWFSITELKFLGKK